MNLDIFTPSSCSERDELPSQSRLCRTSSSQALKISRNGGSPAPLGTCPVLILPKTERGVPAQCAPTRFPRLFQKDRACWHGPALGLSGSAFHLKGRREAFGTFQLPHTMEASAGSGKKGLFMSLTGVVPSPGSPQPGVYQPYKENRSTQGCHDKCKRFSTESSCPATAGEHKRCEQKL